MMSIPANRIIAVYGSIVLTLLLCFSCKQSPKVADSTTTPSHHTFKLIDVSGAKELMKNNAVVILDVRTPEETAEGTISDKVIELDYHSSDFKEKLNLFDKQKEYLVYCRSGGRSGKTLKMMKELGFENCSDLDGGYTAWQKAH